MTILWRAAAFGVIVAIIAAMGLEMRHLAARIDVLEAASHARDAADPLTPIECRDSRLTCSADIERLLSAPQQFNGRLVITSGMYMDGPDGGGLAVQRDLSRTWPDRAMVAIWLNGSLPQACIGVTLSMKGTFRRGPSGWSTQYPAQLDTPIITSPPEQGADVARCIAANRARLAAMPASGVR